MRKHASAAKRPNGFVLVTIGREPAEVLFSRKETITLVSELLTALELSPWIQGEVMSALEI